MMIMMTTPTTTTMTMMMTTILAWSGSWGRSWDSLGIRRCFVKNTSEIQEVVRGGPILERILERMMLMLMMMTTAMLLLMIMMMMVTTMMLMMVMTLPGQASR